MGDSTDGSSNAALGARPEGQTDELKSNKSGWLSRLFSSRNSDHDETAGAASAAAPLPVAQTHGMINLRRMRVEDVAVRRASRPRT